MVIKYIQGALSLYLISEALSLSVKLPGLLIKLPKDFLNKFKSILIDFRTQCYIFFLDVITPPPPPFSFNLVSNVCAELKKHLLFNTVQTVEGKMISKY